MDTVAEARILDFASLEYISSAGLGVLLKTQKRLAENGAGLKIINVKKSFSVVIDSDHSPIKTLLSVYNRHRKTRKIRVFCISKLKLLVCESNNTRQLLPFHELQRSTTTG